MHDMILLANIFSSLFMTGVIWFVQLVHYPSFLYYDPASFKTFHNAHVFKTGLVVIPAMLTELVTSIILSITGSPHVFTHRIGLGIVLLIWLSTFLLQVPLHNKLKRGFNANTIRLLVDTNWARTVLWSIKALLSLSVYC